jgi:hypothetical protein
MQHVDKSLPLVPALLQSSFNSKVNSQCYLEKGPDLEISHTWKYSKFIFFILISTCLMCFFFYELIVTIALSCIL